MKSKVVGLLIACFCWPLGTESVEAQEKPAAIAPAEKLPEGWEEIDERLVFLMVRLANVEASLDAVEKQIGTNTTKRVAKTGEAKQAEAGNDLMDRKGGGPMKWSEFYGTTAEKFFYHPTDRNSTYHTVTVLAQKSPQADNKPAEGVPSRQGLPVHQRPPQFDYIYRANANAKERAEADAAALKGKVDALQQRRQQLETEQAGLWCEIAFRVVLHYDLDKKPLYRFEPLVAADDAAAKQHAECMKAAASFMRLSLSVIDAAQKNQAATFSKIKTEVTDARQKLNDAWLRQGVDVTDRNSTEGKFAALAKRLDDVASNLSDSYVVSVDGDQAKDQQRKETFRGLLQVSLVSYAQIILALDEMAMVMKDDWKIKPDVDKPIQVANLMSVTPAVPARTRGTSTPTPSTSDTPSLSSNSSQSDKPEGAGSVTTLRMKNAADATKIGNHYYKVFEKPMPWVEAVKACKQMGGYLACLETKEEQKAVAKLKDEKVLWLGGYQKGGTFLWLSGKEVTPKERVIQRMNQCDYLAFNREGGLKPRKADGTCDALTPVKMVQGFICEWDE